MYVPTTQMLTFVLFVSAGVLFDGAFSLWVTLSKYWHFFNDTHTEKGVLLNSVQEFIETEASLLLTFFLCLHNKLTSLHCNVTY